MARGKVVKQDAKPKTASKVAPDSKVDEHDEDETKKTKAKNKATKNSKLAEVKAESKKDQTTAPAVKKENGTSKNVAAEGVKSQTVGKKRTQENGTQKEDESSEPPSKKVKDDKPAAKKLDKPVNKRKPKVLKSQKQEVVIDCPKCPGFVLVTGEGDTGQLGLGPDVMDRSKPGRVNIPADVIQVCAGGMHSVCLTSKGEVLTFGCNDEGALGRKVEDDDECTLPAKVNLSATIKLVSAGDSHTAALSTDGEVFIWGTFRDANGPIGIIPGQGKMETPVQIMKDHLVVKIASGSDHLVCLTKDGDIYTLGAAEQGQLGRVPECFVARGGRRGLKFLLCPGQVFCSKRATKFCDIWTGQYCTYAKAKDTGDIYAWGLNNYYQLGIPDMQNKYIPEKSRSFEKQKNWSMISGGQHHAVALDGDGKVYSLGRKEYGRLGLGEENLEEKKCPTLVPKLQDTKCTYINCGTAVSFAVTADGSAYGWGMGSTKQLGQGDDEDDVFEPVPITGKQLENKTALMLSAGGQHTMLLATDSS